MGLKEFRKNTNVSLSRDLVDSIVDSFLKSKIELYTEKSSLTLCMIEDLLNKGLIKEDDKEKFVNEVVLHMCYDFSKGKETYMNFPQEQKVEMARVFLNKIEASLESLSPVVFNTGGITDSQDYREMEHEFIIKVSPENFFFAVRHLYESILIQDLKNFRIVTAAPSLICAGVNAPIKLTCDSSSLGLMIDFLDNLESEFVSVTKDVLPIYANTGSWYGYSQVNKNGVDPNILLCKAVYRAITYKVVDYMNSYEINMPNGESAIDYYAKTKNKFAATKEIFKAALEKKHDSVLQEVFDMVKLLAPSMGIDLNDVLRCSEVNNMVDECFGKETQEEPGNQESNESGKDISTQEVIPTPVKVESDIAEKSINKKETKEPVAKTRTPQEVADLYPKMKKRLEKRKMDLESLIRRNRNFPDEFTDEKDFGKVIKEISQLVNGMQKELEGGSTSELSDFDELIKSYQSILYEESLLKASFIEYVESLKLPETVDEIIQAMQERDKNTYDAAKAFLESHPKENVSLASSDLGIDVLQSEIHLAGVSLDALDLETKKTTPSLYTDLVSSMEAVEEMVNPGFVDPAERTMVLTDVVDSVNKELNGGSAEELPARLGDPEYNLDYKNKEGIIIPSLKSIVYDGDNLKEALKSWGYANIEDSIPKIASHFGINYSGTAEQDRQIINILKNLDKFDMYGNSISADFKTKVELPVKREVHDDVVEETNVNYDLTTEVPLEDNGILLPKDYDYDGEKAIYREYFDDDAVLDTLLAGKENTVLDYFVYYNIKNKFKPNSVIVLHNGNMEVTGKEFAKELVSYLNYYSTHEPFEETVNYFVSEIKEPKPPKKAPFYRRKGR